MVRLMERTFVMIKPDAVRRKLAGEIIRRIENRDFNIIAMKMLTPSRELAEQHYAAHQDKEFFERLVGFIMSGPVIAMVVEGEDAVHLIRIMMGAKDPLEAAPGTIRGDLTINISHNLIHGSDGPETAATEISLWFPELAST